MPGTAQGGKNAAKTNKEKYDNISPYKEYGGFYAYIGAMGGKNGKTGGFYANRKLARIAGKKGGTISRRTGIKNTPKLKEPISYPEAVQGLANKLNNPKQTLEDEIANSKGKIHKFMFRRK